MASNIIRDKITNQEKYENCSVIGISHLPEAINPPAIKLYNLYRVNQIFNRVSFYQKLKESGLPAKTQAQSGSQHKFINILSEFYDRD